MNTSIASRSSKQLSAQRQTYLAIANAILSLESDNLPVEVAGLSASLGIPV